MTPKAYRLFQSKVLSKIFADLQASRTGRHPDAVLGEGATESPRTKPYEFGDSVTHMDIPASFTNALLRYGPVLPVRMGTVAPGPEEVRSDVLDSAQDELVRRLDALDGLVELR